MSDKGHELTDKKLAELEKKLKGLYKQASDEVEKKLDDYLKAFKAKDARHLADLQKDFTKENYEEYIRWRKGQVLISERWEEMRQSLAEDYHHANMEAKSIIDGYMPDIYALNHNYGTYDVEHNALVDTSYTLYDRQTVERLMRDDPDMLPPPGNKVSKRIAEGKDMLWNKSMIQASMWQSITQGESMDKIAKRLAQTVGDKDMAAAVRNARTMTTGAECAGRVDSYKRAQSMGVHLQQEWMATLDGRTRHTHRQLHGECIDVGGTFSNGCRFPGDPHGPAEEVYNCRCTLVSAIKGFEGDKVTYSPKLGEQSFEEWQNEHEKGLDKSGESGIIVSADSSQDYMGAPHNELLQVEKTNAKGEKVIDEWEVKVYKLDGYSNIYSQTYSSDAQSMAEYLDKNINNGKYGDVDEIYILKSKDLKGVSAYNYRKNALYVSEELATEEGFKKIVDISYFPARNLDDVITHELGGHKRHWDIVKQFYADNIDKYSSLEDAKQDYERPLRDYIINQMSSNHFYISKYVSRNAYDGFDKKSSLNELLADSMVIYKNDSVTDKGLFDIVKELMKDDANAK